MSTSFGWGSKSLRALVGLAINIYRAAVGAVTYTLVFLQVANSVKRALVTELINVRVAIEKLEL